jgi:hypothetical protein
MARNRCGVRRLISAASRGEDVVAQPLGWHPAEFGTALRWFVRFIQFVRFVRIERVGCLGLAGVGQGWHRCVRFIRFVGFIWLRRPPARPNRTQRAAQGFAGRARGGRPQAEATPPLLRPRPWGCGSAAPGPKGLVHQGCFGGSRIGGAGCQPAWRRQVGNLPHRPCYPCWNHAGPNGLGRTQGQASAGS